MELNIPDAQGLAWCRKPGPTQGDARQRNEIGIRSNIPRIRRCVFCAKFAEKSSPALKNHCIIMDSKPSFRAPRRTAWSVRPNCVLAGEHGRQDFHFSSDAGVREVPHHLEPRQAAIAAAQWNRRMNFASRSPVRCVVANARHTLRGSFSSPTKLPRGVCHQIGEIVIWEVV